MLALADRGYETGGFGDDGLAIAKGEVCLCEQRGDAAAQAQLKDWFPGRTVYVIEMLESWYNGGGVHCHTNDMPLPTDGD